MLKVKMINNLSILRIAAFIAIISFSFEIASPYLIQEDAQIEIVDIDLEEDTEDEEFDSFDLLFALERTENIDFAAFQDQPFLCSFKDQHLLELPTPPPDCA
jgi:hypothetical protein